MTTPAPAVPRQRGGPQRAWTCPPTPQLPELLDGLAAAAAELERRQLELARLVADARLAGGTWDALGAALNLPARTAWRRYAASSR